MFRPINGARMNEMVYGLKSETHPMRHLKTSRRLTLLGALLAASLLGACEGTQEITEATPDIWRAPEIREGADPDLGTRELALVNSGTWTTSANSMPVQRTSHGSALMCSGRVLVAGGTDGNSYHASADVLDPATGLFTPTGNMSAQ